MKYRMDDYHFAKITVDKLLAIIPQHYPLKILYLSQMILLSMCRNDLANGFLSPPKTLISILPSVPIPSMSIPAFNQCFSCVRAALGPQQKLCRLVFTAALR